MGGDRIRAKVCGERRAGDGTGWDWRLGRAAEAKKSLKGPGNRRRMWLRLAVAAV